MTKPLSEIKSFRSRHHWRLKFELEAKGIYLIIPTGKIIRWGFDRLQIGDYIMIHRKYNIRMAMAHKCYSIKHGGKFSVKTIGNVSYCKRVK